MFRYSLLVSIVTVLLSTTHATAKTFPNNDKDLLDINVTCVNEVGAVKNCHSYSSLTLKWNNGVKKQKDIVRSGKYAYEITNAPGDCGYDEFWSDCKNDRERTEISMNGYADKKPKWYKFSIYIPEETKCTRGVSCSLWQIHTKKSGPAYMLRLRGDRITMSDFPNAEWSSPTEHSIVKDVNTVKNQWLDFVVYIEQYEYPKKGKLVIFLNGKKIVDHFGYRRNLTGKSNYMKFGIYKTYISRAQEERKPMTVYYDSITIARTCEQLNLEKEGYNCKNFQING